MIVCALREREWQARVDPEISHYANLHEIRAHLRYHDYLQQEYRTRQPPPAAGAHQPLRASPSALVHSAAARDSRMIEARAEPRGVSAAAVVPGSHPHQYSDPRVAPPRGHTVPAQHQPHSHLYSRSADARMWEEQGYDYGRSLTPGPPIRSQTPNPTTQARAHTPVNQTAYAASHLPANNGAPPQLAASHTRSYADNRERVFAESRSGDVAYRQHSEYDSSTKNAYTRERQVLPDYKQTPLPPEYQQHTQQQPQQSYSYGSLPRQRDLQEKRYYSHGNLQPSLMSSSAQV